MKEAERCIADILKQHPKRLIVGIPDRFVGATVGGPLGLLVDAYRKAGRLDDALRVSKTLPHSLRLRSRGRRRADDALAVSLILAGREIEAKFFNSGRLSGYHRESLYGAAVVAIQGGNFDQANTLIKKADALKKESPKLPNTVRHEYFNIARALAAAGRRSAAVERLRASPVDKHGRHSQRVMLELARIGAAEGATAVVKGAARAAVPKLPNDQQTPKYLTQRALLQTRNRERMRATLLLAERRARELGPKRVERDVLIRLAETLIHTGERERAKALLLWKLPHVVRNHWLMVTPLVRAGATDEAFAIIATFSDASAKAETMKRLARAIQSTTTTWQSVRPLR